ncbi:hypothetical protein N1851_015162 [Merluccius polli]|uniref:Uncharacterized protein n=1 Tax=Merluccius polli TaxID=89951 RepID=A0AA47MTD0_MERPO|nr:hypothetical protein N1851_015162 [Merluccius polli]
MTDLVLQQTNVFLLKLQNKNAAWVIVLVSKITISNILRSWVPAISLGIPMLPCALEISNCQAMTGSSRKNLQGVGIQSQNEEGRKDDDA